MFNNNLTLESMKLNQKTCKGQFGECPCMDHWLKTTDLYQSLLQSTFTSAVLWDFYMGKRIWKENSDKYIGKHEL